MIDDGDDDNAMTAVNEERGSKLALAVPESAGLACSRKFPRPKGQAAWSITI